MRGPSTNERPRIHEFELPIERRMERLRIGALFVYSCYQLQRQVDSTDREIDRLVYELYGLTEEEIRIVEGG